MLHVNPSQELLKLILETGLASPDDTRFLVSSDKTLHTFMGQCDSLVAKDWSPEPVSLGQALESGQDICYACVAAFSSFVLPQPQHNAIWAIASTQHRMGLWPSSHYSYEERLELAGRMYPFIFGKQLVDSKDIPSQLAQVYAQTKEQARALVKSSRADLDAARMQACEVFVQRVSSTWSEEDKGDLYFETDGLFSLDLTQPLVYVWVKVHSMDLNLTPVFTGCVSFPEGFATNYGSGLVGKAPLLNVLALGSFSSVIAVDDEEFSPRELDFLLTSSLPKRDLAEKRELLDAFRASCI